MADYSIDHHGDLGVLTSRVKDDKPAVVLNAPEPPPVVPPPHIAPAVANVTPAAGTPLARTGSVSFEVTDADTGLLLVLVFVRFTDGTEELVYNGSALTRPYAFTSSVTSIAGGLRFTLRRASGWPSAPTVVLKAVDAEGNLT